ncbi:MAG TPA: PaaI family thioesterase [Nannocystaceae bacterium]|nr:PaaI family thioesterase [Nannocystaceae bacterium]
MSEPPAPDFAARVAAAKNAGEFTRLVHDVPFARMLGLSLAFVDDELVGRLAYAPRNIGNAALPALHGGTIAALLESTAIFAIIWEKDPPVLPRIVSITVEYLRTGKPVETSAHARITRAGRRIANVHAAAWQDDRARPIATASAIFLLG